MTPADRLLTNLVAQLVARTSGRPNAVAEAVIDFADTWELDLQDIATLVRIASGEHLGPPPPAVADGFVAIRPGETLVGNAKTALVQRIDASFTQPMGAEVIRCIETAGYTITPPVKR